VPSDALILALATLAAATVLLAAISLLPLVVIRRRADAIMRRRTQGKLLLTYDDGPGPSLTPSLLELLAREGVKATFFLVGFRALRWPEMCDQLAAAGHELGNHTQNHKHAWKISPWRAVREIDEGYRTLAPWMPGNAPFRPPFGKMTLWTWLAARRRGAPVYWWTADGGDTHETVPPMENVAARLERDGGGVVLLHSHDRGEDRSAYVLALTDRLLNLARSRQWTVCTVSELFGGPRGASEILPSD
jgi:peptidoglycan/xylan/chitin deacetylase (PgdA/CDA1 family)